MQCTHCQKQIADSASVCKYCGQAVSTEQQATVSHRRTQQERNLGFLLVGGSLLLLLQRLITPPQSFQVDLGFIIWTGCFGATFVFRSTHPRLSRLFGYVCLGLVLIFAVLTRIYYGHWIVWK